MTARIFRSAALALFALFVGADRMHDETAGNACNLTAWHYLDVKKRAFPTDLGAIIDRCERARDADTSNPRYHYQLGRAYYRKTYYSLAWLEYKTATELGHALGTGAFAHITDEGYGADADPGKAADLMLVALRLGGPEDDAFNMRRLFNEDWTPEFWMELRKRLALTGHITTARQLASRAEVRAALEAMTDK